MDKIPAHKVIIVNLSPSEAQKSRQEVNEYAKSILTKFDQSLKLTEVCLGKLQSKIKSVDYCGSVREFLLSKISERVKKIELNAPGNEKFKNKWHQFQNDFAYLQYLTDESSHQIDFLDIERKQLVPKILAFMQEVKNEELILGEEDAEFLIDDDFMSLCQVVAETPDIMCAELASIMFSNVKNESSSPKIKISVNHLLEAYHSNVYKLKEDFLWVMEQLTQELSHFEDLLPPAEELNESAHLFRKIISTPRLLSQFGRCLLLELNDMMQVKVKDIVSDIPFFSSFDENELKEYYENPEFFYIKPLNFMQIEYLYEYLEKQQKNKPGDYLYDLDECMDQIDSDICKMAERSKIKWTFKTFKSFYELCQAIRRGGTLVRAYIQKRLETSAKIASSLKVWYVTSLRRGRIDPDFPLTTVVRSLEDTLAFINTNSGTKKIQSKKKKNSQENAKELSTKILSLSALNLQTTVPKKIAIAAEKNTGSNQNNNALRSSLVIGSQSLKAHQDQKIGNENLNKPQSKREKTNRDKTNEQSSKILSLSSMSQQEKKSPININFFSSELKLLNEVTFRLQTALEFESQPNDSGCLAKIALRQSLMFYQDLNVISKQLKTAQGAILFYWTAYHALEQLMRYINLKQHPSNAKDSYEEHNLNLYWRDINLEGKQKIDVEILRKMYLSNYWLKYNQEQLTGWRETCGKDDSSIPSVLRNIEEIFSAGKSENLNHIFETLPHFFKKMAIFSHELTTRVLKEDDSLKKGTFDIGGILINLPQKSNIAKIEKIRSDLEEIVTQSSLASQHSAINKLQQTIQNLKMLEMNFDSLSGSLSSDELSLYVRMAAFEGYLMLKNLLQAICTLKLGDSISEKKDLAELYKELFKRESNFLIMNFHNANKVLRYLFEYPESQSKLHALCLKAEFLREHPEFDKGFKFDTSQASTKFNFIAISQEGLNAVEIVKKLDEFKNEAVKLVNEQLIPELKKALLKACY